MSSSSEQGRPVGAARSRHEPRDSGVVWPMPQRWQTLLWSVIVRLDARPAVVHNGSNPNGRGYRCYLGANCEALSRCLHCQGDDGGTGGMR